MNERPSDGTESTVAAHQFRHAKEDPIPQKLMSRQVTHFRGRESGQTTVVMALFMATFLFGFVAMAVDVEALFHAKRQAQAAADGAAVAAAEESSNGQAAEQTAANQAAAMNGFNVTPTIHNPPTQGNYVGATGDVEVVVTAPIQTFFARMVTHSSTMNVSARAVAAPYNTASACVCLDGTSGTDLNLSNDAKLSPSGCGTMVNSNSSAAVTIEGGSTLGGTEIGSISTNWDNSGNVGNGGSVASGTKVVEGISTQCTPTLPTAPTFTAASCTADPLSHNGNGGSSYSVGPGSANSTTQTGGVVCYNSLDIGANGDAVNLNAGIYVINNGELHFQSGANNASNTGGSGVFFYLTGTASLVIDNGANVNLTAPTSGTYANILVYQAAADTSAISIAGGSNVSFNGAIYAPSANVTLSNGSGTSLDADLLANSLTMTGGGTLNSSPLVSFGALGGTVARIVE
jgi:Flp pilus assembly protein TadG